MGRCRRNVLPEDLPALCTPRRIGRVGRPGSVSPVGDRLAGVRFIGSRLRAGGDPRGRGQAMADTLVCRATGQSTADAVGVEIQLVMTDETLLGSGDGPARIVGHGPIPAGIARRLARCASESDRAWVRRLYVRPDNGRLVAMESKRRTFRSGLRQFIAIRDEVCRTPWCGAPIRHADHVVPVHAGGLTSAANGQGLCEQCNQVKEGPGWQARPSPDGMVITTTPSGERFASRPPPVVPPDRALSPPVDFSHAEARLHVRLAA